MAQDLFPEPRMRRQSNYRRDGNCQVLPADSSITAAAFAAKRSYFAHQPQADEASACGYSFVAFATDPIEKTISRQHPLDFRIVNVESGRTMRCPMGSTDSPMSIAGSSIRIS